jgi:hypothetical protein
MIEGVDFFKLTFFEGGSGEIGKVVGRYAQGDSNVSARSI